MSYNWYSRRHVLTGVSLLWMLPATESNARQIFDVRQFGAIGNGIKDDRAAIQRAIDVCCDSGGGLVIVPEGRFRLSVVPFGRADGRDGVVSLQMRSNVTFAGHGARSILETEPFGYGPGAFYRLLGSDNGRPVENVIIRDMVFDGNGASQCRGIQAGNILLECARNVSVRRVTSKAANGTAIMLRGSPAKAAHHIAVRDCLIQGATYIGIQCSQFFGCAITGNQISGTADNAIDVYGEDGTTTANGRDFLIRNNRVRDCGIGLFVETCMDGIVDHNIVASRTVGIAVNRINGEPRNIRIEGNVVNAATGIRISGDTGGIMVIGNDYSGLSDAGIQLGTGNGNVSRVTASRNRFSASRMDVPIARTSGRQASWIEVRESTSHAQIRVGPPVFDARTNYNVSIESAR